MLLLTEDQLEIAVIIEEHSLGIDEPAQFKLGTGIVSSTFGAEI